jgi:Predicted acetyltransferase
MSVEISVMTYGHPFWDKTISFADNCSWKAGSYLAHKMRNKEFSETERVLVASEGEKIIGYSTFAKKDELPDDVEYTPFIGFVFVDERSRGKRVSERMINAASDYAKSIGYEKIYIMSGEQGLYEKYGFVKIGDFKTIYGTEDQLFQKGL